MRVVAEVGFFVTVTMTEEVSSYLTSPVYMIGIYIYIHTQLSENVRLFLNWTKIISLICF